MRATDVFPRDMPEKVCVDFMCKVIECTKEKCSFAHPRNATKLQKGTLDAICCHFIAKKVGWLKLLTFIKLNDLDHAFNVLMGGNKGTSSSKTA